MNVAELVTQAATRHGERTAFRTLDGATVTWAEVDRRVTALAAGLAARGVVPGDRVAIVLPNSVDFAVAFWGALRAGCVVVPANPAYTAHELRHILTDSTATLAISAQPVSSAVRAASEVPICGVAELEESAVAEAGDAGALGGDLRVPTERSEGGGFPARARGWSRPPRQ